MSSDARNHSVHALLEENEMLREEVRVAQRASDISARLVVEQFSKIEEILNRLEQKASAEQELGEQLAEKLRESEEREVVLARDRTRLEEMQIVAINMMEDITAAREVAEEGTRSKSEFLANMSHEIRTPMTAILGYIELIADGCPRKCAFGHKDHREYLSTVTRNADHLLEIINGILDLSKVESGRSDIERTTCSPIQLIADVQSLMQIRADQASLRLQAEFVGDIPETIHTDATRVKQVLINLVGNALKFTVTGGVRLVTRLLDLEDPNAEPMLQFEVIDTGVGIPPEQFESLFQPFSQLDSSTTRRFGGTGLGLAISKRLAHLLGGDIRAESEPGSGSTFCFTVATGPLDDIRFVDQFSDAPLQPQPQPPPANDVSPRPLDCRILLAEDGHDNQRLVSAILEKAGAEVAVAENGAVAVTKALEAWKEGSPHSVILMDMQMPVMDGYEATERLREEGYTAPIIALTAHAMPEDREKCLASGCDEYVPKPVNRAQLIETIRSQIDSYTQQANR